METNPTTFPNNNHGNTLFTDIKERKLLKDMMPTFWKHKAKKKEINTFPIRLY